MAYQAGQRNFQVPTGADNIFLLRFHRETELRDANAIAAGDFITYSERIWPVYTNTPAGTGKTTLKLGHGAYYDPELTLNDDDQVPYAPAKIWTDADMRVAEPDTLDTPAPSTRPVPTEIIEDGTVCQITIDQLWLEPYQQAIDYAEGGPSGMSLPYDLVGVFDGHRVRVLTGSINIIRSAASPPVDPPEVVV